MKLARTILAWGIVLLVYEAGTIMGHIQCLNNYVDKYGDDILEKRAEIVDNVGPRFTIKVVKPSKS